MILRTGLENNRLSKVVIDHEEDCELVKYKLKSPAARDGQADIFQQVNPITTGARLQYLGEKYVD